MANAALYNLLVLNDQDQEALLINNTSLLDNIRIIKQNNIRKLDQEIFGIRKNLLKLQNQLLTIVDNTKFEEIKNNILDLTKTLDNRLSKYNELIQPTFDDMSKSHFLFLNNQYKPFVECSMNYLKTSINTKPLFGSSIEIAVPSEGNFLSDMALHLQLSELKPENSLDKVRYADFLGHRLIKKIQLVINNNIIDEYTGEFYNVYYNIFLPDHKKKAWLACIGQEMPVEAILIQDPINDNFREKKYIYSGYQTLKFSQEQIDLYIPLLFWFNINKNEAFLNNFPFGRIVIKVEFENISNIATCLDVENDIYHERFITPVFTECELYSNHIYINQDIQDLFISRLGFTLIRTHLQINKILNTNKDLIHLGSELKFPVEDICIYARPDINESGIDSLNLWYKNSIQVLRNIKVPVMFKTGNIDQLGTNNITYYDSTPLFNSMALRVNNGSLHGTDTPLFYQSYISLVSGNNISSNNNNMYYLAYNLYPRSFQPSGYVNMSRTRNITFQYSSSLIEAWNPVNLYIHATAINFIVYNNNTAMLNFSQ
jgi:hypothetical protein